MKNDLSLLIIMISMKLNSKTDRFQGFFGLNYNFTSPATMKSSISHSSVPRRILKKPANKYIKHSEKNNFLKTFERN